MDSRTKGRRSGVLFLAALLAGFLGCDRGPDAPPAKTDPPPASAADPSVATETLAFDITGMT